MTTSVFSSSSATITSTRSSVADFDLLPHDVGVDRQLAAAAIHQHGESDRAGPTEIGQLVERGAHGAAGVKHVVDDHDVLAVEVPRQIRRADHRARTDRLRSSDRA